MSHDDVKLQKCVRLALRGQEPKDQLLRRLASYLCSSTTPALGPRSSSARRAAAAIHGLPSDAAQLRSLITGANVFRLDPSNDGDATIQLDIDALLQQAKEATTTGILTVELPSPVGYIDDVHPLRPGQRSCAQWVKFAECKFGTACVFNHPELKNSTTRHTSFSSRSSSRSNSSSQILARPAEPHPAGVNTCSGSSSSHVHQSNTPSSVSYSSAMTGHVQQHTITAPSRTADAALLPHNPPSLPPAAATPALARLDELIAALGTSSATPPAVVRSGAAATLDGPSGSLVCPAIAVAAAAPAVCPMFRMRGACLSGSRCPYNHPARGSQAATPEPSRSATPDPAGRSTAATAASASTAAVVAADLTPAAVTEASTSCRAPQQQLADDKPPPQPLTWQQAEFQPQPSEQLNQLVQQQQQQQQQDDLQDPLTPQQHPETFTWQQRQQQNKLEQLAARQHKQKDRTNVKEHYVKAAPYPIMGQTSEGLPHRPGAPNCSFYMHTGTCKFEQQCVYHHPDYPAHPLNFVRNGFAAAKWPLNRPVPYSRIVMHLSRIWDYDSCPEAQLKTWMARYLISVANPDCRMWDKSAAQPIVVDDVQVSPASSDKDCAGSPLGRYSCELSRAGEFLQRMSRDEPDDDAAAEPASGSQKHSKLRLLFSEDPYFHLEAAPHNRSQFFVKLNIAKMIETLNW